MKGETVERRRILLWALPASLILHALIAAFLVYGLPDAPQQPQEEQAVNVELVPPPDPPKPKPAPAPSPKKPPEQKVEKPPAPQKPSKIEALRPVFQFGDKDTGPRKSLDGASAQDNSPSPAKEDDSKPPVVPQDAESKPATTPDSGKPADTAKIDETPIEAAKGAEPTQEKQATPSGQDADKQAAAAATPLTALGGDGEVELPASAQAPKARPENVPKSAKVSKPVNANANARTPGSTDVAAVRAYSGLPGVRNLYSKGATGDAFATTSMADVPRDERAGELCASVLQQELLDASYIPPYQVPVFLLKVGNIIAQPNAHFRTRTTWYDLSLRCEVDTNATRVLSFAYRVERASSPEESARLERSLPH